MEETEQKQGLSEAAIEARSRAYAPYSGFTVGAAIETVSGEIFEGCNIENISYSATNCAERTALFAAVAGGHREFRALAVTGAKAGEEPKDYCVPCAVCLQVLREFCPPEFPIYVIRTESDIKKFQLKELLPIVFDSLK